MSVLKSFTSPSMVWVSEYGVKVYLKRFRVSRVILKEFPANIDEDDFMPFPHRNYVLHVRTSFCLQAVSLHMIAHTHTGLQNVSTYNGPSCGGNYAYMFSESSVNLYK